MFEKSQNIGIYDLAVKSGYLFLPQHLIPRHLIPQRLIPQHLPYYLGYKAMALYPLQGHLAF